jgi:small subunit ribosomal protein S5
MRSTRGSELDERVIQVNRVSRKTKGGNKIGFSVLTVVGDRKGKVGMGLGKAPDVTGAIRKSLGYARRSMVEIPVRGTTIPHRVEVKYKAARVLLKPAPRGTGVIAGGVVRAVVEAAGVRDVVSKILGTSNKVTNVRATIRALETLKKTRPPARPRPARRPRAKGLAELGLTPRLLKLLEEAGMSSLDDLQKGDLTRIKGVGPKAAEKIKKALSKRG